MSTVATRAVNTNPMIFEDLATSLATLASYARDDDVSAPIRELEHLYKRALQEPPSYAEITNLTGHSLQTVDRQRGRAAWLMMNVEGLQVYGVHSRVWHKVGETFSAPIIGQVSRVLGIEPALTQADMQRHGVELELLDVLGVKDDAIWLVQVVTCDDVADSALDRTTKTSTKLFRSAVYNGVRCDAEQLSPLFAAKKQMELAFPQTDVATLVLVLHSTGPDFELYQIELSDHFSDGVVLDQGLIRKNSIDYADQLSQNRDSLLTLPHLLDSRLFQGLPPCRGGRTLGMLASAATRQLDEDRLMIWERHDFIQMLRDDFDYEVEKDKVRHDLDDRLVAQGFFRKWGPGYYVSMKGIARYQYCLGKFTKLGRRDFNLDMCIAQRDRILERFGCLS